MDNNLQRTPGPWKFHEVERTQLRERYYVVALLSEGGDTFFSAHAFAGDAHLVAAAPDLLEVAKRLLDHVCGDRGAMTTEDSSVIIHCLRYAVDKAEGRKTEAVTLEQAEAIQKIEADKKRELAGTGLIPDAIGKPEDGVAKTPNGFRHTPGPWVPMRDAIQKSWFVGARGCVVAIEMTEGDANATAAVPELLSVAKSAASQIEEWSKTGTLNKSAEGRSSVLCNFLESAIAKAEGRKR